MSLSLTQALLATAVIALVTLFCRVAPFLFMRRSGTQEGKGTFLKFVERSVPPVAMTVLAVNAVALPCLSFGPDTVATLAASAATVGLHLWRRNPLLSIIGGTILYMTLRQIL